MAAAAPEPLVLRQNYSSDTDEAVSVRIRLQLYAYYVYLSLAAYFDRPEVGLKHFTSFFLRRSHHWMKCAKKLMWMLNKRGGCTIFDTILKPHRDDWSDGAQAMEHAFRVERTVTKSLLDLYEFATKKKDSNLCDFLQCYYLRSQVRVLREIAGYLTNLRKIGTLGEDQAQALFDKLTLERGDDKDWV
ncbi:ferritin heavy chain-like [Fukomys damarensis]|uniref:Ferritin n=1 Tax=Fukomys damarensis TaxID=885580 RepID=A0A091CS76_FUKDA|nr:ferritin heavy chain-like [Fukomys damarensis]KFO20688.1 Ferritin heavy chain [Fukomys damarensis]